MPWVGKARLGGEPRQLLAYAACPPGAAGSVFAIPVGADGLPDEVVAAITGLCELAACGWIDHAAAAAPEPLSASLVAAQERGRVLAELSEAHEATLTAVLAALRARDVPDAVARGAATDLAVAALIELRDTQVRDRGLAEEPADAAFARLEAQLAPIARYATATLELAAPASDRAVPAEIAHAARATSRGIALVVLEQDGVGRIRIAWQVEADALLVSVRDDGPGTLRTEALAVHRIADRVRALDGTLAIDAVDGWGSTVRVRLPLAASAATAASAGTGPLALLGDREREVLVELARGSRNAQIAEALTVTPHTVKFHVANILRKLGVSTRGEAAAIAHEHGLSS